MEKKIETAVLGGGCFWCTEAAFLQLKGVVSVVPGYAGGHVPNPTYQEVCGGTTGHAEVVKIEYDPSIISYGDLLSVFFAVHDPTTKNRQGNDSGEQYRSIILYENDEQKRRAEEFLLELGRKKIFAQPIITEVKALKQFFEAEAYHHRYFEQNPQKAYCQAVIAPKIAYLQKKFSKFIDFC